MRDDETREHCLSCPPEHGRLIDLSWDDPEDPRWVTVEAEVMDLDAPRSAAVAARAHIAVLVGGRKSHTIPIRPYMLDGLPALRFVARFVSQETHEPVIREEILLQTNGIEHRLELWTSPRWYARDRRAFEAIAQSWRRLPRESLSPTGGTLREPSDEGRATPADAGSTVPEGLWPQDGSTVVPCIDEMRSAKSGQVENSDYGFSFQIPPGLIGLWDSASCAHQETDLCHSCPPDSGRLIPLHIEPETDLLSIEVRAARDPFDDVQSTDAVLRHAVGTLRYYQLQVAAGPVQPFLLDGLPAERQVIRYTDRRTHVRKFLDTIALFYDGTSYWLQLRTESPFEDDRELFEGVVSSWKLLRR